ncbi:L-glutamine synthetase [Candidatus Thermokryptus mobilis]|uniref:Glutamine synthetase n=1 Tax=Candidatus Thermokryptus mobilis TaxID=1643428 RepID=A0A0S4MWM6_9BACT|nr:type I glutamate--ammonia ligase [Candidatus Thermokryptus mobilis]CUU03392.1 L-glutamine synthetase [Candidatus Thermokryptus mobilis]
MKSEAIENIFRIIKEHKIKMIDLKFMDFPGQWQHFSVPVHELTESSFEDGFGFDGSSIRGWKSINESDMLVIPDPTTAFIDPFIEVPTLSLICDVYDPITKEKYERCPRYIAQKAEAYLKSTGIADVVYFGPEAEFFIFDNVRFDQNAHEGYYYIDSIEGQWNSGRDEKPNLGYKPRYKEGYFPVPPTDSLNDIRNEMVLIMEQCGLQVEAQHHEVATGGQCEIDFRFAPLVKCADNLLIFKYIVKNVARRHGKTATFMPKPIFGDNGSGMHCHQSLWKNGQPLFYGNGYANLSEIALYYIGGILKHAPALCAFTNPTTNSYKRLVPGFEAPVNLAYSQRNRSAAIRIPTYSSSPKAKRIEVRFPDGSCNPYLAFSAMLMAGIDGIINKIDPGEPLDKDIYSLPPEELKNIPSTPGSLEEALKALERDHEFLLRGDVFTEDVIEAWIKYKWEKEVNPMRMRPHPYEFMLYFDV